jgi:hypothetical protein
MSKPKDEDVSLSETAKVKNTYINPYTGGIVSEYTSTVPSRYSRRLVYKGGIRDKPKGWLFPTQYEFYQINTRYMSGRARFNASGYTQKHEGALSGVAAQCNLLLPSLPVSMVRVQRPFPDVDQQSQAEVKALNKLLTHGKDRDGTWNVGVAWAERRETAKLLEDTAKKTVQVLRDLRQGKLNRAFKDLFPNGSPKDWKRLKGTPYYDWYQKNFKRFKDTKIVAAPEDLATAYLALQNGFKPGLADLHNAAEALANRNTRADWVITGKGYYKKVITGKENFNSPSYPSLGYVQEYHSVTACFVRIDASISDQWLHSRAQLGLTSPAAVAWEAYPLTYVADYFVAMGDWLQSLGAPAGMEFYSGSVTRYGKFITSCTSVSNSADTSFTAFEEYCKWDRKPLDKFPMPIPPLSLKPGSLNGWQLGNLAALATLWLTKGLGNADLNG